MTAFSGQSPDQKLRTLVAEMAAVIAGSGGRAIVTWQPKPTAVRRNATPGPALPVVNLAVETSSAPYLWAAGTPGLETPLKVTSSARRASMRRHQTAMSAPRSTPIAPEITGLMVDQMVGCIDDSSSVVSGAATPGDGQTVGVGPDARPVDSSAAGVGMPAGES